MSKPAGNLRKRDVLTSRKPSEKEMSKPAGNLRKKRCPNQQETYGKRDVLTRRRYS
jgi:hypothetical protein